MGDNDVEGTPKVATVNIEDEVIRVRLPKKSNNEQFAIAELMMGANHIRVRCSDGITRLGRIKGKMKKEGVDS